MAHIYSQYSHTRHIQYSHSHIFTHIHISHFTHIHTSYTITHIHTDGHSQQDRTCALPSTPSCALGDLHDNIPGTTPSGLAQAGGWENNEGLHRYSINGIKYTISGTE